MAVRTAAPFALAALVLCALPGMAGCDTAAPVAPSKKPVPGATKGAAPVSFERETGSFAFTYEYPPEAAALPQLAALLNAERSQALAALETEARTAHKEAKANDYPFSPYMLGISWRVTGEAAPLLTMIADISSFSGGAHGNSGYDVLVWDKSTNQRLTLDELFTNLPAALEPMRDRYCTALNAERSERRGDYGGEANGESLDKTGSGTGGATGNETGDDLSDVSDMSDVFTICPPFSDLVLLPYASGDDGFDRMIFIAAPYVAGPYVEGAYEISMALPGKTLNLVKPAYRNAFIGKER